MSHPVDLDGYDDDETLFKEAARRRDAKRQHRCSYCGERLDNASACKLNNHTTPVPDDSVQEAMLQALAAQIDWRLPSRRGFVLVVLRYGEQGADYDDTALASYVSSIAPSEVPGVLTGIATYITEREQQRALNTKGDLKTMKYYDVRFATDAANGTLLGLVEANVAHPPAARPVVEGQHVLVWRCATQEEAAQIEARINGALGYTVGVQPAPQVDEGGLPDGGTVGGVDTPAGQAPTDLNPHV